MPASRAGVGRLLCTERPAPKTGGMASLAARRARRPGPRLFEGPMLFARTRREVAELLGLLWLAVAVARLFRSKRMKVSGP